MKKTIKYSILGLAALCTVVLCGGYYMLGHALKPEGLITRSRNIAESYNFMFEQYPRTATVGRQFGDRRSIEGLLH